MGLDEFAVLIFEIASVALREGGLDVVVPVHPAEFHQSVKIVLPAHQSMFPRVPFKTHAIQQRGSPRHEVLVLLVVQTSLHVHPFSQRARRTRNARSAVQLLVFLKILKSLLPGFRVGIGDDPLEADRIHSMDAFPRQPLASAHAFPLFTRDPFAALCLDESTIVVVVIIIIFVVIIIVGYIGLELLSLLGHLLPLRPHVGDPAAELSVL
mmetsp:Transcript_37341/g.90079  ORF Transcript_37341/g.90079 Transcript_37341/m.90079 type:complete len:210 (-) Transcript_37341:420-1049(-)